MKSSALINSTGRRVTPQCRADVSEYGGAAPREEPPGSRGLPKQWSAWREAEVVLRLLRGEDIGEVSREVRVAPPGAGAMAARDHCPRNQFSRLRV